MSSSASLLAASESTASTRARAGGAVVRPAKLQDAVHIFELVNSLSGDGTLLRRSYADICENVRDFQVAVSESGVFLGCGALHRLYPTSEGWVFLTAPTQENWEQLAVLLDAESMVDDPRFVTSTDRAANDDALAAELLKRLSTRPAREWEKLLLPAGIGCVEVNEQSQAEFSSFDERVREAKLVVPIEHPLFGELYRYAPPATLSETPGAALPGCAFAQHSRSILLEFGRDDDQIEDLVRRGVVKLAE